MGRGFFVRMKFDGSEARRIAFSCISNRGARDYQEDSFGFSSVEKDDIKANGFSAVVADGMGGLSNGDRISGYTVSAMLEMLKRRNPDVPVHVFLSQAMQAINGSVLAAGIKGGSTAAAVCCLPEGVYWCTVGDSRVYLFRDGMLTALNEDSDYMNQLVGQVMAGDMSFEDAYGNAGKDALAGYIGCRCGVKPDGNSKPFVPRRNDKLLICSDGVYNALSQEELASALYSETPAAAEAVENAVIAKGYSNQDNFTAVVLEFTR